MARAKVAGDDQAAAELDRMAARFELDAEFYTLVAEQTKAQTRLEWMTELQQAQDVARQEASARAFARAARDLHHRASRLRNGTAGR